MADFKLAIDPLLENEGGYVNNPADPGGETRWGISKHQYPTLDIKNLTLEDAKAIYLKDFWHYSAIQSQEIANKLLDLAVNMGPGTAHKLAQRSLGAFKSMPASAIDGVLGSHSISQINSVDSAKFLLELRARQAEHYALESIRRGDTTFLLGWMRRAVK